jgi:hypothetical protein
MGSFCAQTQMLSILPMKCYQTPQLITLTPDLDNFMSQKPQPVNIHCDVTCGTFSQWPLPILLNCELSQLRNVVQPNIDDHARHLTQYHSSPTSKRGVAPLCP